MDVQTDGRTFGRMDRQTKIWLIEVYEKHKKNISNVFKLAETPIKQLCDGHMVSPTDQLTNQKLALRGL